MKHYALLVLLCSLPFISFSQEIGTDSISNGTIKVMNKNVVAIEHNLTHVLYKGISNPLTITVANTSCDEFEISASNNLEIKTVGDCHYQVKAFSGKSASILVFKKKSDQSSVFLDSISFRILDFPVPEAAVCGYKNGEGIPKDSLLAAETVKMANNNVLFNPDDYQTLSFDFYYLSIDKKKSAVYASKNGKFTMEMKRVITNLVPNERILIENIFIQNKEGKSRKLQSIILTVSP